MSIVRELEQVLAEEQVFLLSGNYEKLEALIHRKTALAEQLSLNRLELPSDVYMELSKKAAHNDALLDAAKRGLQSAMAQLKQLSDGETQKTYSREGQRRSLSRKPASIVQKI